MREEKKFVNNKEEKRMIESNLSILDNIRTFLNNGGKFTEKQAKEFEKKFPKVNGLPQSIIQFENRSLKDFAGAGNDRKDSYIMESTNDILNNCTYFKNLTYNVSLPKFNTTAEWKAVGSGTKQTNTLSEIKLTPKRIYTNLSVSREYLMQDVTKQNERTFENYLIKAIEDKLVETILSDISASVDNPKGIFNNVEDVTSISNILAMQNDLDKLKGNNTFILSTGAKNKIFSETKNYNIFDNGFLGNKAIFESRCKDNYFAYLDLSKLFVCQWGNYSITIDNITNAANGLVDLYIEGYFDFAYADDNFIKVGKFA